MVKIDKIQQAILRLNGGEFQEVMDEYLYKKYKFINITRLGSKSGSSKTTRGTPDTYVELPNSKYILIMYGTVEKDGYSKLKQDIEDAYNIDKTFIDESKIEKVICCYTSNNINIQQREELKNIFKGKNVELIGIDDLSFDIAHNYQSIANTYLDVKVDSGQFCTIEEFIKKHDKNSVNAPISINFLERKEKKDILDALEDDKFILLIGKAGTGKTKLAIEVCKEYKMQNENVKCLCIKNNGCDIYDDLMDYIENNNDYLIFIDDINQMQRLKTFMDFINDKKDYCNIKVIATVRDYMLENVISKLNEYFNPKLYSINSMEDEQIKTIIENEYSIKNRHFQDKILEIAKGNPRLAVLSAKGIKEKKIEHLNSVIDLFKSYYFPCIKENNLNDRAILILFFVALLGPISLEDENAIEIINKFKISTNEFIDTIKRLSELEIVDYYQDKATKINDQNFGNYIVHKVLIEDRTILISDLIRKLYLKGISKVISAINMMGEIFYNKDEEEYITEEIKDVWKDEPYSSDAKFLYYFYNVDRIKAIKMIKSEIDKEEYKEIDLKNYKFEEQKNYKEIKDKKIGILSNFKYGEASNEAIELLLEFYKKRPDLIMEFYYAFVINLGIDENSMNNGYEAEIKMIDIFMKKISLNNKNTYKIAYLLIKIIDNFLEYEHQITRQSRKKLTLNFIRITLLYNQKVLQFRKKLFEVLEELYKYNEFKEMIDRVLLNYSIYPSDDETENIFVSDLENLKIKFFEKWTKPNFIQSKILKQFENICKNRKINIPSVLENYKNNKNFLIINKLELERDLGENFEKAQEDRKNRVIDMIKNYKVKDFSYLFNICNKIEKIQIQIDSYNIGKSIFDILEFLINRKSKNFLKILNNYIEEGSPFKNSLDYIICKIMDNYKKEDIVSMLENSKNNMKYCYLNSLYSNIEKATEVDLDKIFKLLDNQINEDEIYIIDIRNLMKYEEIKKGTIQKYCNKVFKLYSNKTNIISKLFWNNYNFTIDEMNKIIYSFSDIEVLENLYIIASNNFIDNQATLGIEILKNDEKFIYKIIQNIRNFQVHSSELENLFNKIWKLDNYNYYINIAVEELEKQKFIHFDLEKIFEKEYKEENEILLRKEKWISKYIQDNNQNKEKMYDIFSLINSNFQNKKMEYIQDFIELNKSIEDFKKIPLFSNFSSWSGSEVPLIDEKVRFLNELSDSFKGLDYIEHKDYLNSKIEMLKKYKNDIKVREYLENYI